MPPFAVHMLTKFQFSYPSIHPSDSQFKFDFEFSRIVSDLPVPVVALWHWGVLHLMCSCLCFCSWCVAIIICNWNLFKLLSAIFSSCVLFLCAGDERNGHKATWEHLFRVTINIPLKLFIFFSTFTPQQVWEHLLRLTSHWHCLSSFTFTHQQVYLLLLLLLHWTRFVKLTWSGGRVSTENRKRHLSPRFLLRTLLKQVREGRWSNSFNQIWLIQFYKR